ncbi:MAG: nucleotide exchange factor GrpE [Legionella sp.]|nr:nucleotide exchange factor GrpE [Legionella sp.]
MSDKSNKDWKKFKEEIEQDIDESLDDEESEDDFSEKASLDHPSYTALEEKLTISEQKAHENWEKAARAAAELENVRRRAERDVANAHRYSLEKIIASLLPVVDSLEQALQLADASTNNSMVEGLELTLKLFLGVLEKYDVKQINPEGAIFDPQEHEAMSMLEVPDALPNSIVTVFQKGYKLHDRVIRPARVIVAKAKTN